MPVENKEIIEIKKAMFTQDININQLAIKSGLQNNRVAKFLKGEAGLSSNSLFSIMNVLGLVIQDKKIAVSADRLAEVCNVLESKNITEKTFVIKEVKMSVED